jgi:photosystem II stability/assembly factor-like uncharacterized protein
MSILQIFLGKHNRQELSLRTIFSLSLVLGVVSLGFSSDVGIWQKTGQGVYESDARVLKVDPTDDDTVYVGTSKALYKSLDQGKTYKVILRPSGEQSGVNDIYIVSDDPETIFAATDAGLYESRDGGNIWSRVYNSSDTTARQCYSIFWHERTVYLGTGKGLFKKRQQEVNWDKVNEGLDGRPVYQIVGDDQFLYLTASGSLFSMDKQSLTVRKIFSPAMGGRLGEDDQLDEDSYSPVEKPIKFVQSLTVPKPYLFLVSSGGIYLSGDHGTSWDRLRTGPLNLEDVTSLLVLENNAGQGCSDSPVGCWGILAGTMKGVFFLSDGQWVPVYKGMETTEISYLAKDARGTVYAVTDRGIFYLSDGKALPSFFKPQSYNFTEMPNMDLEPDIHEVHQLAVDYAEVSPEKIKRWRRQVKQSAWLPALDMGVDSDRDWSSSDSIYGTTSGGGSHYVGPDDKTRGANLGWDVSLSWDLADLVWSSEQTSIDSRSKLMVELREDILNEVTRLYFERRRIQWELASGDLGDPRLMVDKKMRVEELTALIDALTGGEFSRLIIEAKGARH